MFEQIICSLGRFDLHNLTPRAALDERVAMLSRRSAVSEDDSLAGDRLAARFGQ